MKIMSDKQILAKLRIRATKGDVESMWLLGTAYLNGSFECVQPRRTVVVEKSDARARRWLRKAAEAGSTGAMLDLASLIFQKGVESASADARKECFEAAYFWERRAWRHGETLAAWNLAITCSAFGKRKACFGWLCRAAEIDVDSLCGKALCYAVGYGVRKDLERARKIMHDLLRNRRMRTVADADFVRRLNRLLCEEITVVIKEPFTKMLEGKNA